jgi:putative nucleotidyltransferase with HDIG domain
MASSRHNRSYLLKDFIEMPEETPKSILVGQKEKVDRDFIHMFLDKIGGFRVIGAASAADVIQKLRQNPDLILVDPKIEGNILKAAELIRRMPKLNHVGLAIVTADLSAFDQCKGKGFDGIIEKPFTPKGLLAKIWKILESTPPLPGDGTPAKLEVDIDSIEGLPTLPSVYAQVEQLCEDPDVDADDLAKVIETDPSITMKLLKLSNSAFFGFNREIKSVKDAVSLLGNQTVKNAVLSISVFEATKGMETSGGLDLKEFWRHSAACGSVVKFIAKKMRIDREESFTAGILHDIGKVILDGLYSQFYEGVFKTVAEKRISIVEAEETALGLTHTKLGQELAESWGIPSRLIEAISQHHRPHRSERDPELASMVHVADAVSRNLAIGSGGDPFVPVIHPFAFNQLAVNPEDLVEWEEEILQGIEKDMAFLSAIA